MPIIYPKIDPECACTNREHTRDKYSRIVSLNALQPDSKYTYIILEGTKSKPGEVAYSLLISEETGNYAECSYQIGGHAHLAKNKKDASITRQVYAAGEIYGQLQRITNKSGTYYPSSSTLPVVEYVFDKKLEKLGKFSLHSLGTEIHFDDEWSFTTEQA